MRDADIAMYVAKGKGKGRFSVFEAKTHEAVVRGLELRGDLQRAIDEKQFELYYQPVVHLASGAVVGVEALVRVASSSPATSFLWQRPPGRSCRWADGSWSAPAGMPPAGPMRRMAPGPIASWGSTCPPSSWCSPDSPTWSPRSSPHPAFRRADCCSS